jgi:importin-7
MCACVCLSVFVDERLSNEQVIKEVIRIEFPNGVPHLIPSVLEGLGTDDLSVIVCSLSVFRVIAKVCSFRPHEERLSLFEAVGVVFPSIEQLMEYLFSSVFADMENLKDAEMYSQVGDVLVLIMKCFYNSTNLELGPYFLDETVFDRWSNYMAQVIQIHPVQGKYSDITDTHHPLWISKKWTLSILFRMFVRHGNPHFCSEDCKPFANRFQTHYAPVFCELLLGVLFNSNEYPHMAPKVLTGIFNFFGHAVQHGRSHMVVMPHAERLLFGHVFVHLCFREEDHELWVNDPVEFVQRQYDIFEEFDSLPHSAVSFFSEFCHTRATVVPPIVETLMTILDQHERSPVPTTKYGAMKLLGTLSEVLVKKKYQMKDKIEGMLGRYVLPELNSSEPYLRAMACWTLQRYSTIEYQTEVLEGAVMGIHQLMGDEHLPVRAEAGIALQHFMKNESVKDYLKPNIAFILEQYLHLMEEIENDHLISALEEIIRLFGDDITPFAVELMKRLIASFQKLVVWGDLHSFSHHICVHSAHISHSFTLLFTWVTLFRSMKMKMMKIASDRILLQHLVCQQL